MKTITLAFVTSRYKPMFEWFKDSLLNQIPKESPVDLVIVDLQGNIPGFESDTRFRSVRQVKPKPNVWQGAGRLTDRDWWAMSNARNTALCLANTDYIAWVDDRCVLGPRWLEGIRAAAEGEYAVCGTYEKRHGMGVHNGVIMHGGIINGKDGRVLTRGVQNCYHQFWGGTMAMPIEWALKVNGFEEGCDGLGAEDYIMGMILCNAGYVTKFDPRVLVIQDRTPGETGPDMPKTSKERFPHDTLDKGHKAIERFGTTKRAEHQWNLREIREAVLRGEPFPAATGPQTDWFDGQKISEIKPP